MQKGFPHEVKREVESWAGYLLEPGLWESARVRCLWRCDSQPTIAWPTSATITLYNSLLSRIVNLKGYVFFSSCVAVMRSVEEYFQNEDKNQVRCVHIPSSRCCQLHKDQLITSLMTHF